jgi:LCP family protein required for cell wall assembly
MTDHHKSPPRRIVWVCAALVSLLALAACGPRPAQVAGVTASRTEPPTQTPWVVTSAPTQTPVVVTSAPPTATAVPTSTSLPQPASATPEASPNVAAPTPTVSMALTGTPAPANASAAITTTTPVSTRGAIPTPPGLDKTDNILVLGADVRPGRWKPNTDSIMVVAIDHESKQVGIVSIPRDLYINIPGWGEDRINAAAFVGDQIEYPGGGPALARRMVEETVGLPTQHYVIIRMEGLERLVDALGGVTVNLECPLYEQTPDPKNQSKLVNWSLPAGPNLLNGADAKKFATYRYIQSDFGRVRRQQQLIWAIRNRALQLDVIPRIPELWTALKDTFETDLGLLDMIQLARLGLEMEPQNVHGVVLDQDVMLPWTTPGGGSVLIVKDQAALEKKLAGLFSSQPIADLGKKQGPKCPPPPAGFPNLNPTPVLTATPEITPTATETAQS